ncbi:ZCCHC4 [Bugula neritina]|uniref:ZCCHC4 n=1 Tax=Bugula neritina TaxID=10212 RepID=A0A7J7JCM9_BUGNE|nr:ZCCHC4 [Bugula neritina]
MQQSDVGYELCEQDGEDVPYCPHGPTLLFSRKSNKGDAIDKFYACAAYRKRKDCNFYQKFGPKESEEKQALRKKIYLNFNSSNRLYRNIMEESIHKERIKFCLICGVVIPNELCADNSHTAQYTSLSATDLRYPSRFLTPKESNASNAQYFFSADVIDFISSTISTLHFDKVLCIGTPSIHEHIKHSGKHKSVATFLLDLDVRMRQFHKDYAHYNMFNHHFYEAAEEERFHQFMASSKSLLIIIDPPYGGLVQALSVTLKKIVATSSCKSVSRLLFFPYFMEPQVEKHLPISPCQTIK